jgi:hypothetical protein
VEAWLNYAGDSASYIFPVFLNHNGLEIESPSSGGTYAVSIMVNDAIYERTSYLPLNSWVSVAATRTGSTYQLYDGGNPDNAAAMSDSGYANAGVYKLGAAYTGSNSFGGKMDEVRISNIVRSADWIATGYNNQSSPGTFVTVGSPSGGGGGGGGNVSITVTASVTGTPMTVDGNNCTAPCSFTWASGSSHTSTSKIVNDYDPNQTPDQNLALSKQNTAMIKKDCGL